MIVTFWGVRGSVPVPGPGTVRYGGNTSCVGVEVGSRLLVLDAGTGIRALGEALEGPREIAVLLSHRHADHLQGLPFFAPLFDPEGTVSVLDGPAEDRWSPLEVFDGVRVPLDPGRLGAGVRRVGEGAETFLARWGIRVRTLALRHPGGSTGYRIEHGGRSFVHVTDNELGEEDSDAPFFQACAEFCRGADLLCHDAQYLREEMPRRRGRGHSSVERVCELAAEAAVGRLVLFHHDPSRTDEEMDRIDRAARERTAAAGLRCDAAFEGMRIDLREGVGSQGGSSSGLEWSA